MCFLTLRGCRLLDTELSIENVMGRLRKKLSKVAERHMYEILHMRFCGAVISSHYPWPVIGLWAEKVLGPQFPHL